MEKPYIGDWAISSWNAQGLLASSIERQQQKLWRARCLAATQDIVVLQETHGNKGKCRGLRTAKGLMPFWSNGPGGEAGVGAWVKEEFLRKFDSGGGGHRWIPDVVPGRAAILRCWSSEGKLQIGMVYLHTGHSGGRAERLDTLQRLVAELEAWGRALTIITGDFNFVVDKMDRISR